MRNKIIIFSILVFVLLGFLVFGLIYNKPHTNVYKETASYQLNSTTLVEEYNTDEINADKKYANKIIEVKGEVLDISKNEYTVITLKGISTNVSCQLNNNKDTSLMQINKGDIIVIKGQCSGLLMDVMLVNCVIKNEK